MADVHLASSRAAAPRRELGTIMLLAGSVATAVGAYEIFTSDDPVEWIDVPVPGGIGLLLLATGLVLVLRARAEAGRKPPRVE